jgi:pyridoxal phosphate enzyme (YggS family)
MDLPAPDVLDAVRNNLARIRERIERAATRAGRAPSTVLLLPVTKYGGDAFVNALLALGERDFGENRVDRILELKEKFPQARWHMIGHLQRNKVRKVAGELASLHSLDSLDTAEKLDRRRSELEAGPLDVWIEVNVAREPQKSGVEPDEAAKLARELKTLANVRLRGLMAIPPDAEAPEQSRPHFKLLRSLLAPVSDAYGRPLDALSMGMTSDFEVAIEEGSTVVRVGRALLEGVAT